MYHVKIRKKCRPACESAQPNMGSMYINFITLQRSPCAIYRDFNHYKDDYFLIKVVVFVCVFCSNLIDAVLMGTNNLYSLKG